MQLDTPAGLWRCPNGHTRYETLEEAQARRARDDNRDTLRAVVLTHRGEVEPRAQSLFEFGHDALRRGDKAEAIRQWRGALGIQDDFADPHLWIAKTTDDPALRAQHLDWTIAHDPGNLDAIRMRMVDRGELTSAQAARTYHENDTPEQAADRAVKAKTILPACPVCGGELIANAQTRQMTCRFCGYSASLPEGNPDPLTDGVTVLGSALLIRKSQAVVWRVSERAVRCAKCGAERTVTASMNTRCFFCGSAGAVESDALGTLERPSMVIPFVITEDEAKAIVRARLGETREKIATALRQHNKVERAEIAVIYLPYWIFDIQLEITRSTHDHRMPRSRDEARLFKPYTVERSYDGVLGLPVYAGGQFAPELIDGVSDYETEPGIPYHPSLIADIPAALYTKDAIAASMSARERTSRRMRTAYGHQDSGEVQITVTSSPRQMTYWLALVPMYAATLTERDGDTRTALVNGQNGRLVMR